MKIALCLLATLPFNLPVLAQKFEEKLSFETTLDHLQDHHLLLASNTTEDSKGQATQKTWSKKRITKAEAPHNGTKHIYKTIGEIDLPLYIFQAQQPPADDKRPAIVFFFGFLFYISEPDVQSYSDGLWWALVTITTVGYGDITPLTNLGRIIASSLMIMGIGFIATITAAVSSYFISSFNDKELTINELGDKLDKLEEEIKSLKKEINDK